MRVVGTRIPTTGEDRKIYSTVDSTATAGQTVFAVNYDEGKVACWLNGIRLVQGQDFTYTASGVGSQIALTSGIVANDYVEVVGYQGIYSGNALVEDRFVVGTNSTGSGGAYNGSAGNHTTVFPVANNTGDLVCVYRNGIKLVHTTDFTVQPTASTVTLQSASNTADEITVHVIGILQHSNFVPVTGGTFTGTVAHTGDITFGDNNKAKFGAGNDLQIYHDGSNSYVDDAGTGRLYLRGNDRVQIQKYTGEDMVTAQADGTVKLYYDNAKKLETTSTGVTVTGTLSGNIDVSSNTLTTSTAQKQAISATAFASGTKMIFNQTSAPTGWTKDTSSNNNSALRVVTGTAGTGGSQDFTSAFGATISVAISNASHTLTTSQIPAHTHISQFFPQGGSYTTYYPGLPGHSGGSTSTGTSTTSTGGGGSHTHNNSLSGTGSSGSTHNLSVKYVDVIVATKD